MISIIKMSQLFDKEEEKLYQKFADLGIGHKTLRHEVITTMAQGAEIMKKLEGTVCMNLLLVDKDDHYYLVVKNVNSGRLDTNKLGKKLGIQKLTLAKADMLDKLLKVPKGSATIFAVSNVVNVIGTSILIDSSIPKDQSVNFHPMRNDATTTISYDDMIKYVNHYGCTVLYF